MLVLYGVNSANLELFPRILSSVCMLLSSSWPQEKFAQDMKGRTEAAQYRLLGTVAGGSPFRCGKAARPIATPVTPDLLDLFLQILWEQGPAYMHAAPSKGNQLFLQITSIIQVANGEKYMWVLFALKGYSCSPPSHFTSSILSFLTARLSKT